MNGAQPMAPQPLALRTNATQTNEKVPPANIFETFLPSSEKRVCLRRRRRPRVSFLPSLTATWPESRPPTTRGQDNTRPRAQTGWVFGALAVVHFFIDVPSFLLLMPAEELVF